MIKKRVGIVGYGEIGQSLEKYYLGKEFDIEILDTGKNIHTIKPNIEVMNIAIPFIGRDKFVNCVAENISKFSPKLVIIHSTVTPGTTLAVINKSDFHNVVHSPVRGVHPNLYEGLKTFVKFIGGENEKAIKDTQNHYSEIDIKSDVFGSSKSTELAKVLSTTYYGMCIAFHNDMNNLCEKYQVKYEDVATRWNNTYNEGYKKLGMDNVVRPVLYPPKNGKIGGHCVIPNAYLCREFFDSMVLDYILSLDQQE